jgi:hypothetical protein
MKKSIVFLILAALLLAACGGETAAPEEAQPVTPTPPDPPKTFDEQLLSAVELLGITFADESVERPDFITDGAILILADNWTADFTPDDYRRYFFGTWEDDDGQTLTIDDTEENRRHREVFNYGYFRTPNNAIIRVFVTNAGYCFLLWVDCDNPDVMYSLRTSLFTLPEHGEVYFYTFELHEEPGKNLFVYTKTDAPIAEPQDGYTGELRLEEISAEHGIDMDMLIYVSYGDFNIGGDSFNPIYLLSEEPDKFVFKSKAGYFAEFDVVFTVEKIDGEWVRTVEADPEQYAAAIAEMERSGFS